MQQHFYYETFPLHPPPERLESLTSYLTRLAEANKLESISSLAEICFPDQAYSTLRHLRDYPLLTMELLQTVTTCTKGSLLKTTFYHLGKKFGHSIQPYLFPAFLSTSLAKYLRYCPRCITDQGFYSLAWRFTVLPGCHIHACRLLEECPHCRRSLPIFSPSLKIGICHHCRGELRAGKSEPLAEEKLRITHDVVQDLEYLLSPQPWETASTDMPQQIGQYFSSIRGMKHLTVKVVSDQLARWSIRTLEQGGDASGGTSFQGYLSYAQLLGFNFRDMFSSIVEKGLPTLEPSERNLQEQIRLAAETLQSQKKPVTQTAISQLLQLPANRVFGLPSIRAYWKQWKAQAIGGPKTRSNRQTKEQEEQVYQAIQTLIKIGEPVTFSHITDLRIRC
jgi:hypothetical protein